MSRTRRAGGEESVNEPESVWGEDTPELKQIIQSVLLGESVKASEIERQVEWTRDVFEFGYIANAHICADVGMSKFFLCHANGRQREIHTDNPPAGARQGDDEIGRASCRERV